MRDTSTVTFGGTETQDIFVTAYRKYETTLFVFATWVLPVAYILGECIRLWSGKPAFQMPTLNGIQGVLSAFVFLALMYWFGPIFAFQKHQTRQEFPDVLAGEIDARGVHLTLNSVLKDLPWDAIRRVRMDERFIVLNEGFSGFHILAREYFYSDAEWEAARTLVRIHGEGVVR